MKEEITATEIFLTITVVVIILFGFFGIVTYLNKVKMSPDENKIKIDTTDSGSFDNFLIPINCYPNGATVYINDKKIGIAPIIFDLRCQYAKIKCEADGYESYSKVVVRQHR